jgi:uncharacterized protein (DUF427 family)
MYRAFFEGKEIARSDRTIEVEGNQYFPKEDVNLSFLEESDYHTTCPWKGLASYYDVVAGGKRNENAAWYYPAPKEKASMIKDYIAFWKGVEVKEE